MNRAPEGESDAISAAYERRVRLVCGGDYPVALQLRGRLDPSRWVVEWSFARWVGSALGVAHQVCQQITFSNALILASVVWRDDLEDGELTVADPARAHDIGAALFEAAMEPYRDLLPSDSRFWPAVEHWMGVWRGATIRAARREADEEGRFEPSALAVRGSPMKIPALALCLLAERPAVFPTLEASIDHTMSALVLYDHFVDWREDIADSRWNAFVESAITSRRAHSGAPSVADVEAAMLTQPLMTEYFAVIDRELVAGAACAVEVGVDDLARHLDWLARQLRDEGRSMSTRYVSLGDEARQLIFGSQSATA